MGGVVSSLSKGFKGGLLQKASDPLNVHNTFDPLHVYGNPDADKKAAAQAQLSSMSTETFNAAQPLLKASQTGTLTPQQQAVIDQYKNTKNAALAQEMASAGLSTSTASVELGSSVDEEALSMGQQFLQEDFSQALQLLGISADELGANVQISLANDAQNAAALSAIGSTVGAIFGGVYGGPAGASAGASAGGAVGGALGGTG